MAITDEEKQQLKKEVLDEIKAASQDVAELPEAATLAGVHFLPVLQDGKVVSVPVSLVIYNHPATHAAPMIVPDATHRFVTDTEKAAWNAKADNTAATTAADGLMSASDKQKLDDLPDVVYSKSEVDRLLSGAASSPTVVQEAEHVVGTWIDPKYGERIPLYESIVSFELGKDVVPGDLVSFTIPGIKVEKGSYFRFVNIWTNINETYCQGNGISATPYYPDSVGMEVIFNKPIFKGCTVRFRVQYVKYHGDILTFTIKIPVIAGSGSISIAPPKLKYFKKALFTPTCDDSNVTAYCNFWAFMNHRKVWNTPGKKYFHKGWTPGPDDTYILYDEPLDFDNGTGRRIRYSFGCAIWPNWGDAYNPYGRIKDTATSTYAMYICWDELCEMRDYGISMMYHNVDERIYDKTRPEEIVKGFAEDRNKTHEKLGVWMKILGQPDGNTAYITAAQQTPLVQFMRQSAPTGAYIYIDEKQDLYHKNTYGGRQTSDREQKKTEIAEQIVSDNPYWVGITVHESAVESVDYAFYKGIYDDYSANPEKDILWVASWDEAYEWFYVRDNMQIVVSRHNDEEYFYNDITVYVPDKESFDFRNISLLATGNVGLADAEITNLSANIIKAEYVGAEDGTMRINLNFDAKSIERAEKYTSIFESTADELDKEAALYFVGWLDEKLARPYMERIEAVRNVDIESLTVTGPDTLGQHQTGTFVVRALPENNTHMEQIEVTASAGMVLQSKQVEGNMLTAAYTATIAGAATVTAVYKGLSAEHALTVTALPEPVEIPIASISITGDDTLDGTSRKSYVITCLPENNTGMSAVRVAVSGGIVLVGTSTQGNVITAIVEGMTNGAATLSASAAEVTATKEITVSGIEEKPFRIVASFGYGYTVAQGGVYDANGGYTKIRIAGAAASGTLYATDGTEAGTYAYSGAQKQPGVANYGPVSGDDSALYRDYAIESCCYLDTTSLDDGIFECSGLLPGTYRVRFFLNTGNTNYAKQTLAASYSLSTSEGSYPVVMPQDNEQLWFQNFDNYVDTWIVVGEDGKATFTIHKESAAQIACWQILDFERTTDKTA